MEGGGETMEERLHKAAVGGSLEPLEQILTEDPMILARIKVGCSIHTPLHVAAFHGHLNIVKKILEKNEALSGVLDSRRWSPLHLASAEGHDKIVKELALKNPDMCTSLDGDARNPFHLAAMKGKIDALEQLFEVRPCRPHELMNAKDVAGNTILHLAVKNKRFEIVKYLLEKIVNAKKTKNPIKAINAVNNCGYTAQDILLEIEEEEVLLLKEIESKKDVPQDELDLNKKEIEQDLQDLKKIKGSFRKVKALRAKDLSQGEWLSKKRDILMVVASLIATMAFQAGVNPPGGFWQDNTAPHRAGEAIMAYNYPNTYPFFVRANTTGFVASVSTILLLITGWPFKKKLFMWILVVIMWVTITSMAFTYAFSIVVVTPKNDREPLTHTIVVGVIVWCSVMAGLLVAHTIRVINWWLKNTKDIHIVPLIKNPMINWWLKAKNHIQIWKLFKFCSTGQCLQQNQKAEVGMGQSRPNKNLVNGKRTIV